MPFIVHSFPTHPNANMIIGFFHFATFPSSSFLLMLHNDNMYRLRPSQPAWNIRSPYPAQNQTMLSDSLSPSYTLHPSPALDSASFPRRMIMVADAWSKNVTNFKLSTTWENLPSLQRTWALCYSLCCSVNAFLCYSQLQFYHLAGSCFSYIK
jgi:hypothetical protein